MKAGARPRVPTVLQPQPALSCEPSEVSSVVLLEVPGLPPPALFTPPLEEDEPAALLAPPTPLPVLPAELVLSPPAALDPALPV